MRTWYIRIVPVPGHEAFAVEGMEVESDGYTDEVSDFDTWGTFPTFAEAEACRDSVVANYHKAMPWTDYAQELYEGSPMESLHSCYITLLTSPPFVGILQGN